MPSAAETEKLKKYINSAVVLPEDETFVRTHSSTALRPGTDVVINEKKGKFQLVQTARITHTGLLAIELNKQP